MLWSFLVKFHTQRLKKETGNQFLKSFQEEDVHYNYTCFVEAVEASKLMSIQATELDFENSGNEKQEKKLVTLEDIGKFFYNIEFTIIKYKNS